MIRVNLYDGGNMRLATVPIGLEADSDCIEGEAVACGSGWATEFEVCGRRWPLRAPVDVAAGGRVNFSLGRIEGGTPGELWRALVALAGGTA